jgi:hypothetical protein
MTLLRKRPQSAVRSRLAELIAERAKIVDRANEIMAASKRLDEAIAAPAAAQADLNRLSAAESAAIHAWSLDPTLPKPVADAERRETLARVLREALAAAAAAQGARQTLDAELTRENQKLPSVEMWTRSVIAEIVAEEIPPLAAATMKIGAELIAHQQRLIQAVDLTKGIFQSLPPGEAAALANAAMVTVSKAMSAAHEKPLLDPDKTEASRRAWHAFAADLREDAFVLPAVEA